jgi:hypothetical protein
MRQAAFGSLQGCAAHAAPTAFQNSLIFFEGGKERLYWAEPKASKPLRRKKTTLLHALRFRCGMNDGRLPHSRAARQESARSKDQTNISNVLIRSLAGMTISVTW